MVSNDFINLAKIEAYLSVHGYPYIKQHGDLATSTPYLVIHHAPLGIAPREKVLKYLYKAYKTGDLKGGSLTFF